MTERPISVDERLCATCAKHPAAVRLGLSICVVCAGIVTGPIPKTSDAKRSHD